ncbi:DUF6600 domain-containing protein [Spirosoma pomorum]
MNALKKIGVICLIVWMAVGVGFTGSVTAQPGMSVPIESFYDELDPYGQWTQYPGYGDAWIPSAGPDFQPYASNGHWIVTEYGNTWVSDYDWGWAPFHYGRWIYDPAYGGWLWLPGSDWGPAWVSWRSGGGYYGWAPLGPGANINVNVNLPAFCWTFVPQAYITSPRLYNYRVSRPNVVNIYQNTTIINNVYRSNNRAYVYGPQRIDIERVTRRSVPVYRIDQMNRPGRTIINNGSVGFYHPGNGRTYNRDYSRADRNRVRDFNNYNTPNSAYGNNYPGGVRSTEPAGGRPRAYEPNAGNYGRSGNSNEGRGGYAPNATPNRNYDSPFNNSPGGRAYERPEQPQRTYPGNDVNPNRWNGGAQPERSYGRGGQTGGMRNESMPNARQERPYQQAPTNEGFQGGNREMGGGQRAMPNQPGQPSSSSPGPSSPGPSMGGGERQHGSRGPR